LRLGMDARTRRAAQARGLPRLSDVGARRLAGAEHGDRCHRSFARDSHARLRRRARALARRTWDRRRALRRRIRRRARNDERDRRRVRRRRARRRCTRRRMRAFAELYAWLDATTSTTRKVDAMSRYFADVPADDAAWAAYFLAGGR